MMIVLIIIMVLALIGLVIIKQLFGNGTLMIGENKQDGTPTYAFCIEDLTKIEKKKFFILRVVRK